MTNWNPSNDPSASAALIKASEDTADLLPDALKMTSLSKYFTFLNIVIPILFLFYFRFGKLAREVWGYQRLVQIHNDKKIAEM